MSLAAGWGWENVHHTEVDSSSAQVYLHVLCVCSAKKDQAKVLSQKGSTAAGHVNPHTLFELAPMVKEEDILLEKPAFSFSVPLVGVYKV